MKTTLTSLLLILWSVGFSQIPSINQVKANQKGLFERNNLQEKQLLPITPPEDLSTLSTEKLIAKVKEQDTKIEALKKELDQEDVFVADNYIQAYDALIEAKKETLKKLKNEQKRETEIAKMDSIQQIIETTEAAIETLKKEKNTKVKALSYRAWLPSLRKKDRGYFFQTMYNSSTSKTKFLNSFGVSGNVYGISGQSELITDNMNAFRVAFGTVISATNNNDEVAPESETQVEALDRLVNGGGNFYLETILPLVTTIDRNNADLFTAYGYLSVRAATDIKGYGNDLDTSTGNGSGGLYLYLGFSSESRKFNFFLQGNGNYCMGSRDFYRNLSIEHNNGFLNGKLIAGLTLENKFRFTANFVTFGSEPGLRREKITLGFQFLP